jgi:hypothetical protein
MSVSSSSIVSPTLSYFRLALRAPVNEASKAVSARIDAVRITDTSTGSTTVLQSAYTLE